MLRFLSEHIITLKYIFLCQLAVNLIKTFYVNFKSNFLYQQHLPHVVIQSTTKSENKKWLSVVNWTPCTEQITDIDFIMQYLQIFFLSFHHFMTVFFVLFTVFVYLFFIFLGILFIYL